MIFDSTSFDGKKPDCFLIIFQVIEFYNKKLEPMKEGSFGVNEMQDFIKQTAIQFPTDKLKVTYNSSRYFFVNITISLLCVLEIP